ncbi:MAG TPA: hypothetical protein VHP38_01900 [Ruminiclostridium sp.]|nr:hypothetical protein [Ruminiclostridium sp.]
MEFCRLLIEPSQSYKNFIGGDILVERIQFDLDTLLGDTAASDFKGIEFLNCFEYTLWQLMRQNGISDYKAALNTTAFVTDPRAVAKHVYGRVALKNFQIITTNLEKFYGVRQVYCNKTLKQREPDSRSNSTCYEFIQGAIKSGKFVYTLYNNFFDTVNESGKARGRNVYHSTVITGYDDNRQEYIALIDGRYNIGYTDMEKMYAHFERRVPWVQPWILFYLLPPVPKPFAKAKYYKDLYTDLEKTARDWSAEIGIFDSLTDSMLKNFPKTGKTLAYERTRELYGLRIFFYWMRLGCHGNLYLKLRALSEITGCLTEDFYSKFLKNRRNNEIIANILGRVYVNYSYEGLANAAEKIKEIFVYEADELRNQYLKLIDTSKKGG